MSKTEEGCCYLGIIASSFNFGFFGTRLSAVETWDWNEPGITIPFSVWTFSCLVLLYLVYILFVKIKEEEK